MSNVPLGHRLSRELSQWGDRRRYFSAARYRELRKIDSVEELADFLDRTGYTHVRASENVEEVASDIDIQAGNPPLIAEPALYGMILGFVGLLMVPVLLAWRLIWRDRTS